MDRSTRRPLGPLGVETDGTTPAPIPPRDLMLQNPDNRLLVETEEMPTPRTVVGPQAGQAAANPNYFDNIQLPGTVVLRAFHMQYNWRLEVLALYYQGNVVDPYLPNEFLFSLILDDANDSVEIEETTISGRGGFQEFDRQMEVLELDERLQRKYIIGTVDHQRTSSTSRGNEMDLSLVYSPNYMQEGTEAVFWLYHGNVPAAQIFAHRQTVFLRLLNLNYVITRHQKALMIMTAMKIYCSVFKMNTYPVPFNDTGLSLVEDDPPIPTADQSIFMQPKMKNLRLRASSYKNNHTTLFIEAFSPAGPSLAELVFQCDRNTGRNLCMDQYGHPIFASQSHPEGFVEVYVNNNNCIFGHYATTQHPNLYFARDCPDWPVMYEYPVEMGQGLDIPTVHHENPPRHKRAHYFYHFDTRRKVAEIVPEKSTVMVNIEDEATAVERAMIYSTAITLALNDYQFPCEVLSRRPSYPFVRCQPPPINQM